MKKLIFFTFTLTLFFTSCKNVDNPVIPNALPDLLPLQIGNWWAFQRTNYDSTGKGYATFMDTMKVLRDTIIQNERWFITNYHGIWRNAKDGVCYRDSFHNTSIVYLYPLNENDMFVMDGSIVKVISTNEKLITPFGEVSCYHYQATLTFLNDFQINYYLSPGIGFISIEAPSVTSSGKGYIYYRELLISYELK